jgi:NAD(P)-dependent dehydrogenase (short-subunit alcohol dehydrogenase family)
MSTVLVPGGAGGVGEGIVRALAGAGHAVIVPSRSERKLAALRARLPATERLATFVAEIGEAGGAEAVRDRLAREGRTLDAVVPTLGGWWEGGPLLAMAAAEWDLVMNEMLRTHFIVARTFVPVLERQGFGRYIGIGGGAAYVPILNCTPVSIAAAAQIMMTRAIRAEVRSPGVDVLELVVDGPVRTRDSEAIAQPDWITADDVGRIVVELVRDGTTASTAVTREGPILRMRPAAKVPDV